MHSKLITDVSDSKFQKLRKAQYFNSPSVTSLEKKRYTLQPHECGKFDQSPNDRDPAKPFVASELVKIFDVTHTDSSHKVKLLAQDVNEDVLCVPVSLVRFHIGVKVVIVAHSHTFPLKDIRQAFMILYKNCEIDIMNKKGILNIFEHGACFSMKQFEEATLEQLKSFLTKFEWNRMIWIWHDHSCLASHGIVAVMIEVAYEFERNPNEKSKRER